ATVGPRYGYYLGWFMTIIYYPTLTVILAWLTARYTLVFLKTEKAIATELSVETLRRAKLLGFTDKVIGEICGRDEDEVRAMRYDNGIRAAYKMVDTCAAEFDAETPYYYSCYESENEVDPTTDKKKVMVIGSGPIRIGQGVEFDYCSVHSVWALREAGYETIIVNNNPETVSTDFDVADKLYFEPLTPEDVRNIVELEQPYGAVVQFGGQTAIKLCEALDKMGVRILGTSAENMDKAEDRELFDQILTQCQIPKAPGKTVFTCEEAIAAANEIGYPVLVRPSYVLGGQGMHIAFSDKEIREYIGIINRVQQDHPILVDKYIMGKEVEVDAICDGTDILIPGIMEHIERAGVHSGDSISVYPCQSLKKSVQEKIVEDTRNLALALGVIGMINIQFIVKDDVVYIIEANPRSSRTVPYISKITGIPIVKLATQCLFGDKKIPDLGYEYGLQPEKSTVAIKMPVFSFEKLYGADISLGPEMKSTGEVLGIGYTYEEALIKAFVGTGIHLPTTHKIAITVKDMDKEEVVPIAKDFADLGYEIYCTAGTGKYLADRGIPNRVVKRLQGGKPNYLDMIVNNELDLIINTPTQGMETKRDGFLIRRNAVECGVHCLTSLDTARALVNCLKDAAGVDLSVIDIAKI
ncbi:MAG: carbamoyl-phosphate synthase large subunit, partial [Clostridia bacterium]|nr:carbamoyl-phosphate synthase large subunit [Clostridia bacterium]